MKRPVAGLDLSLASTGIAVTRNDGGILTRRVRSSGKKDDTWAQRSARLKGLAAEIVSWIPEDSLVVIESPSYASTTGAQHDRSGLWWIVYGTLELRGCNIIPVTPAQRMTYAVGKGGGKGTDKDNILAATIRRYPDIDITGNDIADAVLLAAIGARLDGRPIEDSLPAANLKALAKLSIPPNRVRSE